MLKIRSEKCDILNQNIGQPIKGPHTLLTPVPNVSIKTFTAAPSHPDTSPLLGSPLSPASQAL